MSRWAFVVRDKLDLLGTPLGVLSDASDKQCLVPWDGAGSGAFTINRHSSQAAWSATRNYITVHLGLDSETPENNPAVFGFFIEEGADDVVSINEEGGEDFKRGGRGALVYLERAIVDHIQRTANQFTIDADRLKLVWQDKKVGRILKDLIDEAQARTPDPLADLTLDFTDALDSLGNAWDTVDGEFNVPIGLDLLGAIETLKGQGLSVIMDPDFTLHAYQDWDPPASGLTFEKAVNIREAADRAVHATQAKSRLLVQGTKASGVTIYKTVSDAGVEATEGVFEGFFRYNRNATVARLEKAGNRRLRALKRMSDGLTTVGVTVGDGTAGARGTAAGHYVPFTDYTVGELVTILVPGEYDSLVKMLGGIVLEDTEAGEYDPSIMFDVPDFNPSIGEDAPGGGKDFAGPVDTTGGGGTTTPAETEIGACVTVGTRGTLNRFRSSLTDWAETQQVGGERIWPVAASYVYHNIAWAAAACPVGGGGFEGFYDRESWWAFTAPADDPNYLGLVLTIDTTGTYLSGSPQGYHFGIAEGVAAAGRYGLHTRLAAGTVGSVITIYVPRSHVAWGAVNSLIAAPDWECARSFFTCNPGGYSNPLEDGRGGSGGYGGVYPSTACTVAFVDGTTGPTSEGVAALGDVDGVNRIFHLIDWDGTGTPTLSTNGLDESLLDATLNRSTGTVTLASTPPAGAVLLWTYMVGPIAGTITLTPDAVAIPILTPDPILTPPIALLPAPAQVIVTVTEPTVSV